MPGRVLSQQSLKEMYASDSSEVFLTLLTLTHVTFQIPLRFCDDGITIVRLSEVYFGTAFDFRLPDSQNDQTPQASLTIANVDRRIIQEIRAVQRTPIGILAQLIRAAAPDAIPDLEYKLLLRGVQAVDDRIEGSLSFSDLYLEPYPGHTYDPHNFPGVFG